MTTNSTPQPNDRGMILRGVLLLLLTCVVLFVGVIGAFGFMMGVDIAPLYAPLLQAIPTLATVAVAAISFGLAMYGLAPALRAYYSPAARADRATHAALIEERNAATSRADLAERTLADTRGTLAHWQTLLTEEFHAIYPNEAGDIMPAEILRRLRVELLMLRPATQRVAALETERNDLRDRVTQLLSQPAPKSAAWQGIVAFAAYLRTAPQPSVKRVRDELRAAGVRIPEGDYNQFSVAVRALPPLSPVGEGATPPVITSVKAPVAPQNTTVGGQSTPTTDGRTPLRTRRTPRTRSRKLPTAHLNVVLQGVKV